MGKIGPREKVVLKTPYSKAQKNQTKITNCLAEKKKNVLEKHTTKNNKNPARSYIVYSIQHPTKNNKTFKESHKEPHKESRKYDS